MAVRTTTAIIVAAGRGERLRGATKVLLPLQGKPVLAHVLDAVEAAGLVRDAVMVAGAEVRDTFTELLARGEWKKPCRIVSGGSRRQDSVAAGLAALAEDVEMVAILDGARPLTTGGLIDRCISGAGSGSAIAALPLTDTLKRVDDAGMIVSTVSRDGLWAAQTPQVFPAACLREAFKRAENEDLEYTDEAALFESLGLPVRVISGDAANIKITWPGDLERAALLYAPSVPVGSDHE